MSVRRAPLLPRARGEHPWQPLLRWRPEWRPIGVPWMVAVSLLTLLLFVCLWTDDDGYLTGLDGLNLIVHEGGHFLFFWFGRTLSLYGGTLLQLLVPLALTAAFVRRGEAPGVALCGIWLFQNLLNVARYVGDARAQQLPLVGGGEHDWYNILAAWHALHLDRTLAHALRVVSWLGMLGVYSWLGVRFLRERASRVAA